MNNSTEVIPNRSCASRVGKDRFPGIEGLRAIAVLAVFGFHTGYLPFGWLGVQLFFVISGFLITDILLRMKATLPLGRYLLNFYGRRFLRIFPLNYAFLLGMTGFAIWALTIKFKVPAMRILFEQIRYAVFYCYDFYSATVKHLDLDILDHLWSLSVEEQFYVVWPFLVLFVPTKMLKKLFVGGIFAGLLFRILTLMVVQFDLLIFLKKSPSAVIYFMPFSHLDAFSFGAYISRFPIQIAKKKLKILCLALPFIGIATSYAHVGNFGFAPALGFGIMLPAAFQFIWGYTLINFFFALLVQSVTCDELFVRILEYPPLHYIGKISYGFYLFHFPIIWFMDQLSFGFGLLEGWRSLSVMFLSLIVVLLVASLSFFALERPFLKLKDRFFAY